ncbi:helix-turn-helix transcriptional regulator [Amycolatopsis cihanbeyliensis]|uniref:Helix-turn-helix protein n=1 Tax=Amycolatopsis cihanbeyliensis TaxID=1128664 RepID=A0A542DMR5_AMYCI|nr:helix-turn-helix transcriptional regulator [Amycolatopsis cihanbeyliensis]TQJ04285.1 helix-turn-helix protein [Amycolatopsis cihanbeyliensis]
MVESFGQALRRLREQAELSQPALARQVPISQSSLSRYESDRQAIDAMTAARLDSILGADGELQALRPRPTANVLNADQCDRIVYSVKHPERIDANAIDALAQSLAAQRRLDDALGPDLLIPTTMAQVDTVTSLYREARGRHRVELAPVVAEFVQFAGWLHAEARRDADAARLLDQAELLADEADDGTLAAQVANFRGYLARQQARPRAVARWFLAAHHTPGAHAAQRAGDAAQAAQGYADLGDLDTARRLLDEATDLLEPAARETPPGTAYWLTPTFQHLNIGLARLSLGDHGEAAAHLATGLDGLPDDQQGAEWATEYQHALCAARESR